MIEAIRIIGDRRLSGRGLQLEELVEPLETGKYGVVLHLHCDGRPMEVDVRSSGPDLARDWLWVGNAPGTTPQDRLTTNNLAYLVCQVIPNLIGQLSPGPTLTALEALWNLYNLDLGLSKGSSIQERYRYIWDLARLGVPLETLLKDLPRQYQDKVKQVQARYRVPCTERSFWQAYAQEHQNQAAGELAVALLQHYIHRKTGIRPSDICLYTLMADGYLLVQDEAYRKHIENYLIESAFQDAKNGTCHLCGLETEVTWDMKKFSFLKFYNNDKKGFAAELNPRQGWWKNYSICRKCYVRLLAGERFVLHYLQTSLGRKKVFIIPAFHLPDLLRREQLEGWAKYLKTRLAANRTLEAWERFAQEVEQYQEYDAAESGYVINLLFADIKNSAVKVNQIIADVPPSRLKQLADTADQVARFGHRLLGGTRESIWWLGWDQWFYLFPLRKLRNQAVVGPYLAFLHALISGRAFSASQLIAQFLETAAIYRYERFGAFVHPRPDPRDLTSRMAEVVLRSNLALVFLQRLGQLSGFSGGASMIRVEDERLPKEVASYFTEIGLDPPRQGLFLLGYLLGEVAWVQGRWQSKPILDKIQFQGVDRDKVIRLSNDLFEKLLQYRLTSWEAESLYAAMKSLLDRSLESLPSPHESVYWILSGYSFATWKRIQQTQKLKKNSVEKAENSVEEPEELLNSMEESEEEGV